MSSDISKQKTKEQVTTVNTKIMKGNISLVKSTYSKDSDSSNYKENRKFFQTFQIQKIFSVYK